MSNQFKISKQYFNTSWNNLNLINSMSDKWDTGILIVEDRFKSRFFKHMDIVKNDMFSGFVIMSLSCLLIETLMQFYTGYNSTEDNPAYKSNQWKTFKDFLKNSPHFKTEFKTNRYCKTFYRQFRCGLLHQAQTKKRSKIKINTGKLIQLAGSKIEDGLIVDRAMFYDKLKCEFEDYLQKLRDNESNFKGDNLREKCIIKMDKICNLV